MPETKDGDLMRRESFDNVVYRYVRRSANQNALVLLDQLEDQFN